ncbi:MAG: FAD-dependent oxidoreductase, partial [Phycisphaerae bacterium]|nr:FAD-dependent oxidoreductase [Phycisphaerae bacterium]
MQDFDVIVIGGGHAGAEAAAAVSRSGGRCALVTLRVGCIGRMSCNPAVGGLAKGQIAREVDALGGLMGRCTDATGIQFRMLNLSKGPAVQSPRAQCDKYEYEEWLQRAMLSDRNITVIEGEGTEILKTDGETVGRGDGEKETDAETPSSSIRNPKSEIRNAPRVTGVKLADGRTLSARCVVVTTGTFLNGLMHTGETRTAGGRLGEPAATGLTASLQSLGLQTGRLKTGTCPRLAKESLDLDSLAVQPGDADPQPFSFLNDRLSVEQLCCWITSTNERVHDLIRANLHRAPLYSGQIQGRGPRYCPSIEDKIVRFAGKTEHHLFLEPESRRTNEIYCNGIPTSLPADVQEQMVHAIRGLERAEILRFGYAVEYDYVPPTQIDATLQAKCCAGLFLAGQINGTSGYEEAAGQGVVAGINAARLAAGRESITIGRDQAYIGVMIDDLVTRGTDEPYRMFTSRA